MAEITPEERLEKLEKRWRELSYICFCPDGESLPVCSACKEQMRLRKQIEELKTRGG